MRAELDGASYMSYGTPSSRIWALNRSHGWARQAQRSRGAHDERLSLWSVVSATDASQTLPSAPQNTYQSYAHEPASKARDGWRGD